MPDGPEFHPWNDPQIDRRGQYDGTFYPQLPWVNPNDFQTLYDYQSTLMIYDVMRQKQDRDGSQSNANNSGLTDFGQTPGIGANDHLSKNAKNRAIGMHEPLPEKIDPEPTFDGTINEFKLAFNTQYEKYLGELKLLRDERRYKRRY